MCETGGGRRSWLRGLIDVSKSYLGRPAAHNLALIMLALLGFGTARSLQGGIGLFSALVFLRLGLTWSRRGTLAPMVSVWLPQTPQMPGLMPLHCTVPMPPLFNGLLTADITRLSGC
jgi:hypothetical protein